MKALTAFEAQCNQILNKTAASAEDLPRELLRDWKKAVASADSQLQSNFDRILRAWRRKLAPHNIGVFGGFADIEEAHGKTMLRGNIVFENGADNPDDMTDEQAEQLIEEILGMQIPWSGNQSLEWEFLID